MDLNALCIYATYTSVKLTYCRKSEIEQIYYCFESLEFNLLGFGLVGFYGLSTLVCYVRSGPLYTYILNIYDLVWLGFMAY